MGSIILLGYGTKTILDLMPGEVYCDVYREKQLEQISRSTNREIFRCLLAERVKPKGHKASQTCSNAVGGG
jgi:hypothetical protein